MKIGAIIQARMGSTRLHGKVMRQIKNKTILEHVLERTSQSKLIEEIIVATTLGVQDIEIVNEVKRLGFSVFCGSESNVLSRYYGAAKEHNLDLIVRITSDCPLIDPKVIDNTIYCAINTNSEIASNVGSVLTDRTFPRGFDVEVFTFTALENAFFNANKKYQLEHVTPYIYEKSKKTDCYKNDIDFSKYRLTLDTEEDFELISQVYDHLYFGKHDFYLSEIIELFEKYPNLSLINAHIEQKKTK